MTGKITLISPPDVYVNKSFKLILVNTTEKQQEDITNWFSNNPVDREISIYFYNNDRNTQWLITAFNIATYKYVNLDNTRDESNILASYLLSLDNSYYSLSDANAFEVFRLLNTSKVDSITEFLEKVIPIEHAETPEL